MMELIFRNIAESDLALIMNWRTMPEVSAYMYTDFVPDMAAQKKWYEGICADNTRLDWITQVDGVDVGLVSIVKIDRVNWRAEVGHYLASPGIRGQGVGKAIELNVLRYVFEELGLNKLCFEVFVSNERGIKLHERHGSVIEGTRRQHIYKRGEFHDIVEMGILRNDWERDIRDKMEYTEARIEAPV